MLYELRKNGKDFYLYSVTSIVNDSILGTEFNTGVTGRVDTLTPDGNENSAGAVESP